MIAGEPGLAVSTGGRPATLSLYSPLSDIVRREPPTMPPDASVREVLERMDRQQLGSIVIADPARGVPLGLFTLRDLVQRVTLRGGDLGQPIASVMTAGLLTLHPRATAHQAALLMARHGVQHVVVTGADGRLAGLVSQADLFGLQRVGVEELSAEIQSARDVEALRVAAARIGELTSGLLAQATGVETLTQFISTLNDLLTMRVIELALDEHDVPPVPLCWIALGSEGRLEQTFATDQDNGLVFECDDRDAPRIREALLPFARAVNEKLARCGFPLCQGGIMAGNPEWCLTASEWRRKFARWIEEPNPQDLLHAAIFFDLRPIHGTEALAERLQQSVLEATQDRPLFLRFMAQNAVQCQAPLGTFRDFVFDSKEFPGTLELKLYGSRPFVDAARILSLAHGVAHTHTAERLRGVADAARMSPETVAAIVDGFHFIHLLRLRNQRRGAEGPLANRVAPRELNDLDRHVLKEAFRQSRKLQERLVRTYQLHG
jgi:CBS domain-containing protein